MSMHSAFIIESIFHSQDKDDQERNVKNGGLEITKFVSEVTIPIVWYYQNCVHPYCPFAKSRQ